MKAGRFDDTLSARVVARRPLFYARGADAAEDRPAHVRAGSAIASLGERLVVVQDDASFFALLDRDGTVLDVALPSTDGVRQFDKRRGNKAKKLDLEACLVHDGALYAFGSGSTSERERVVVLREGVVQVKEARALYAMLRGEPAFAGSELNVEGAARVGDDVVLFQRGNGAPHGGILPVDATARLDARALALHLEHGASLPPLRDVTPWTLGHAGGVRLTFTDGATTPGGALAFLACAEDSPDAVEDGPVTGVAVGLVGDADARLTLVLDEAGRPLLDKAEGLAFTSATQAFVVVDKDDPTIASELLELALKGFA